MVTLIRSAARLCKLLGYGLLVSVVLTGLFMFRMAMARSCPPGRNAELFRLWLHNFLPFLGLPGAGLVLAGRAMARVAAETGAEVAAGLAAIKENSQDQP